MTADTAEEARPQADWPLICACVSGLLVLRVTQVLSQLDRFYDAEFTEMGKLALAISDGAVQWTPLDSFIHTYQYGFFAPGTLVTGFLTALLAIPLGTNGFALIATSILFEVLLIVLWLRTARAMCPRWLAALSVAPLVFPPWQLVRWQLMPYANHSEYIWIPVLVLGFCLSARRRPALHWLGPIAVIATGIWLYRLTVASAVGLALAGSALPSFRRKLLAVGGALGAVVLIKTWLGSGWLLGFDYLSDRLRPSRLMPTELLPFLWERMPQLVNGDGGDGWSEANAPVVMAVGCKLVVLAFPAAAAAVAWTRAEARPAALFALGWSAAALLVPAMLDDVPYRYFVPGWYALLACGLVGLGAGGVWIRRAVAVGFVVLLLGGAGEALRHHRGDAWADNMQLDALGLGLRLGVSEIDHGSLPFYNRMLDEERFDPFTGSFPRPVRSTERINSSAPSSCRYVADDLHAKMLDRGAEPAESFKSVGRGAWISSGRDLLGLWEFWLEEGLGEPYRAWLWEGALAEASLYAPIELDLDLLRARRVVYLPEPPPEGSSE